MALGSCFFEGGRCRHGFLSVFGSQLALKTVSSPMSIRGLFTKKSSPSPSVHEVEIDEAERPYSLRRLMTRQVVLTVINYAILSLVDITFRAIQPLFFSTPISHGGLGLDPPAIGKILMYFGLLNGVFQLIYFARIHALLGTKRMFVGGLLCGIPTYVLFPVMNALARANGVGWIVYLTMALQILFAIGVNASYGMVIIGCEIRRVSTDRFPLGCIFIYLTAASPNRASLGATNGLAQVFVSITRATGPVLATSLFSLSLAGGYLGGGLVYLVLTGISVVSIMCGLALPREVRQH